MSGNRTGIAAQIERMPGGARALDRIGTKGMTAEGVDQTTEAIVIVILVPGGLGAVAGAETEDMILIMKIDDMGERMEGIDLKGRVAMKATTTTGPGKVMAATKDIVDPAVIQIGAIVAHINLAAGTGFMSVGIGASLVREGMGINIESGREVVVLVGLGAGIAQKRNGGSRRTETRREGLEQVLVPQILGQGLGVRNPQRNGESRPRKRRGEVLAQVLVARTLAQGLARVPPAVDTARRDEQKALERVWVLLTAITEEVAPWRGEIVVEMGAVLW